MAEKDKVKGDFDNYDWCPNCDDGWNKKKGKKGGRTVCDKCGGLGLIKKR